MVCATRATKQYIYMLWNDDWKGLGICRRTQYSTLLWPPRKTSSRCKKKADCRTAQCCHALFIRDSEFWQRRRMWSMWCCVLKELWLELIAYVNELENRLALSMAFLFLLTISNTILCTRMYLYNNYVIHLNESNHNCRLVMLFFLTCRKQQTSSFFNATSEIFSWLVKN